MEIVTFFYIFTPLLTSIVHLIRYLAILISLFSFTYSFGTNVASEYDKALELYRSLKGKGLEPAIGPALQALDLAKKEENEFYLVKAHFLVAYLHTHTNNYGKAIIHYLEGARYAEKINDPELTYAHLSIHKNLAGILDDYNHLDLSHRFNNRAIAIAKEKKPDELFELIADNKVHYLVKEEKYQEALSLIDSVLNHFNELGDDEYISIYNRKGSIYDKIGLGDRAMQNYRAVLKFDPSADPDTYIYALKNISTAYREQGLYDSAYYYLERCERDILPMFYKGINEAKFDLATKRAKIAVAQGDRQLAESYFQDAISLIGEEDLASDYFEVYKEFSEFYELNDQLEPALKYKTLYSQALDEHLNQQKEIEELDKKYNIDLLTERYFELLAANQEKIQAVRTAQLSMGSIILLLILSITYLLYQKYKTKNDLKKALIAIELDSEV